MDKMKLHETISALADGQLRGDAFDQGVDAIATDPVAREAWQTYHLIGDVLRFGELAAASVPGSFMQQLKQRLAAEPALSNAPPAVFNTSLAIDLIADGAYPLPVHNRFDEKVSAANDASFKWKLLAGLASLTAVAVIGWTAVGGLGGFMVKPEGARLASATVPSGTVLVPVPQGAGQGVMIRDAHLDELLAAHRQLGDVSALQMPAGFLRNATFDGPSR